jgi:pyruvate dehydrogenase E2 component (dihydrolipoamide acetyltransferase)
LVTVAEFRMPSLGADMDEGTLLEWQVHPGETVRRGDIVATVDTSKAAIDIEVFEDGVIDDIVVPAGSHVPVGTVLAHIIPSEPAAAPVPQQPEETLLKEVGPKQEATKQKEPKQKEPKQKEAAVHEEVPAPRVRSRMVRVEAERLGIDLATVHGSGPRGLITREDVRQAALHRRRVRSSPYARRRASELGIDLRSVAGSGPGGAVRVADLIQAPQPAPPPAEAPASVEAEIPSPARVEPRSAEERSARQLAMRQAIAALMARSKREIPHYYLSTTIDLAAATSWLQACNVGQPLSEQLTAAALLFKAAALACREVPEMNGFWIEDHFAKSDAVHLGIAISLRGGGLLAPAIHNADTLAVAELMGRLRDLVSRARTGRLRSAEMRDPTITVTSLGERGVESVLGVIYPPQVALVGFGKVVDRPWAVDGMLAVRPVVTATLAADHRASDGHRGGLYLEAIDRLLQDPEEL